MGVSGSDGGKKGGGRREACRGCGMGCDMKERGLHLLKKYSYV